MHALRSKASSGFGLMLSGLEHHLQRSEQPLRKTLVRMPGPSWVQKCWMFRTRPVGALGFVAGLLMAFSSVSERDAQRAGDLDELAARRHRPELVNGLGHGH